MNSHKTQNHDRQDKTNMRVARHRKMTNKKQIEQSQDKQ